MKPRLCRRCGLPADAPIHAGGHPERCHGFEAKPREWPILFRAPLVRANRDGRKTVTRRLSPKWAEAKPGDLIVVRESWRAYDVWDEAKPSEIGPGSPIWYEADGDGSARPRAGKLRPSIFLPRWASRDVYPIVSVRAEKLHDIDEQDAIAEGAEAIYMHETWASMRKDGSSFNTFVPPEPGDDIIATVYQPGILLSSARQDYERLWNSINRDKAPWSSNPTIFRVEYSTAATREPGR